MIISLSPQAWTSPAERLTASVSGDVLTVNGGALDFSFLSDGETLPASATDCPYLIGDIARIGSDLHLTLLQPHSTSAPVAARFPAGPQTVTDDDVEIPQVASDDEVLAGLGAAQSAPLGGWTVDQGAKVTAAAKASQALAEARSGAKLSRIEFALACVAGGLMTESEAEAWLSSGTLPQLASDALAAIQDPAQKVEAKLRFIAATEIDRTDPFLGILQAQQGMTDAQVDALFGI